MTSGMLTAYRLKQLLGHLIYRIDDITHIERSKQLRESLGKENIDYVYSDTQQTIEQMKECILAIEEKYK